MLFQLVLILYFNAMLKHLLPLALLLAPALAQADLVVIVNANNPLASITAQEISALYLGRTRSFPRGDFARVFEHPRDSSLRGQFFSRIVGMPMPQVNSYWARLAFAGQATPPQILPNDKAVLEVVRKTPDAIGYVSTAPKDPAIRVVFSITQ